MSNHNPMSITADSFAIIRRELTALGYSFEGPLAAIIERVIHSTADFEFARLIQLSPGAIEAGIQALQTGCAVVCDVNMVRVGISLPRLSHLGGSLHCLVAEEETRQRAQQAGTTRSAMGIRLAAEQGWLDHNLVVVGNAPTALEETIRLVEQGVRPALIIGVPVGFVGAVESKTALMDRVNTVPWITTTGRKGGSAVAVAIVNALLRLATGDPPAAID